MSYTVYQAKQDIIAASDLLAEMANSAVGSQLQDTYVSIINNAAQAFLDLGATLTQDDNQGLTPVQLQLLNAAQGKLKGAQSTAAQFGFQSTAEFMWDSVTKSVSDSVKEAPGLLGNIVADTAKKVASTLGDIIKQFLEGIGLPLLIVLGVVVALVFVGPQRIIGLVTGKA
jgi:hypothetical protein